MKINDALLGALILLGGLAILLEARTFPATHGQAFGPDLFPTIIGVGLMLAGCGLVVSGWRTRHVTGWVDVSAITPGRWLDALAALLAVVGFIALADWMGFVLAGLLACWLPMVRFRRGHWFSSLAIALVTVLAIDWAFRSVLLVPLPQGALLPRLPW
jgi:putative tricarboxylic transport membrane protein